MTAKLKFLLAYLLTLAAFCAMGAMFAYYF